MRLEQSPIQKALSGKMGIKTGHSESGTCKECSQNAKSRNPKKVPLHPNCRCSVRTR